MMRARLAGFCGPGFALELGVGVAMGVELKIVFAGTGKGAEGRGGCKQAMWRACKTEKDRQPNTGEQSPYSPREFTYNWPCSPAAPFCHNILHSG